MDFGGFSDLYYLDGAITACQPIRGRNKGTVLNPTLEHMQNRNMSLQQLLQLLVDLHLQFPSRFLLSVPNLNLLHQLLRSLSTMKLAANIGYLKVLFRASETICFL